MYKTIYSALIILILSSFSVQAKHDKDDYYDKHHNKHSKYEHGSNKHYNKKHHNKKHYSNKHEWKKHHKKYGSHDNHLSKKEAKKLIRQGWTPPGWHKSYHRGDILERDIYKRAKVIDRYQDKGTVRIEVDRTIIHMVHDTREILSILSR